MAKTNLLNKKAPLPFKDSLNFSLKGYRQNLWGSWTNFSLQGKEVSIHE
ncbi:MAG: hypothetical protein MI976_30445 [Pseudomonadales bacterium]|nr:hypothetical protein [Pseudomonadales bacterium]